MKSRISLSTLCLVLIFTALAGCGTSVGNPQTAITVRSEPYTVANLANPGLLTRSIARLEKLLFSDAFALNAVQAFRICVTKVKLEAADGTFVKKDGVDSIEAVLGLVDLSNPLTTKTWGTIAIPTDFSIGEFNVELHKDKDKCGGADYSVFYDNGSGAPSTSLSRDMEFQFKFDPPATVRAGSTFTLDLSPIAARLDQAATAGEMDDSNIEKHLNAAIKGSARQD